MKKFLIFIFLLFFVGFAGLFGAYQWAENYYYSPNELLEPKTVVVGKGSNLTVISKQLAAESVIQHPEIFVQVGKYTGQTSPKFGEYVFEPGMTPEQVLQKLEAGDVVIRKITIPEGLTSFEIMEILKTSEGLVVDSEELPQEGTILPETYLYSYGDKSSEKIKEMQDKMKAKLEELWEKRNPNIPVKTPHDALVLASIVEKETGIPTERGLVASVFTNRLNKGMRLESDPTAVYGITLGQPLGRPVMAADMDTKTAYNTYEIDGLPPTPICHPGADAIAAVLNPPETDYIFFVATGTGGHNFGSNLQEHNQNIREYRKALKNN